MGLDNEGSFLHSQYIALVVDLLGFNQSIFHILVEFIPWPDVAVIDVSARTVKDYKFVRVWIDTNPGVAMWVLPEVSSPALLVH